MDMIRVGTCHYASMGVVLSGHGKETADIMLAEGRIVIGKPAYDRAKGQSLVVDKAGRYSVLYPATA